MTKEQIQQEIILVKQKINLTRKKVNDYSNAIRDYERAYDESNRLKLKYQKEIQDYYGIVKSSISKLDANSTFGNYYLSQIDAISKKEDYIILDEIKKNNNRILTEISNSDEAKKREQIKLQRYYDRLEQLKAELETAV